MQTAGTQAKSSVWPCKPEAAFLSRPSLPLPNPNKVSYGHMGPRRQSRSCLDPYGASENLSRIFSTFFQRKFHENTKISDTPTQCVVSTSVCNWIFFSFSFLFSFLFFLFLSEHLVSQIGSFHSVSLFKAHPKAPRLYIATKAKLFPIAFLGRISPCSNPRSVHCLSHFPVVRHCRDPQEDH